MYVNFPYSVVPAAYNPSTGTINGSWPAGHDQGALIGITIDGTFLHIDQHLSEQLQNANAEEWLFGLQITLAQNSMPLADFKAIFWGMDYVQTNLNFPKEYLPPNVPVNLTTSSVITMTVAIFSETPWP